MSHERDRAQRAGAAMNLPLMRWVRSDTLVSLRAIERALTQTPGVNTFVASSVVTWRSDKVTIARAWLPPGRGVCGIDMQFELTLLLPRRDGSRRWSDAAQLWPGRFAHHLAVYRREDIDGEVHEWLQEALRHACRASDARSRGRPALRLVHAAKPR